jgi:hypothetical protein
MTADSKRRIAMFTGLPPGRFDFQVRARTRGGRLERTHPHEPAPPAQPLADTVGTPGIRLAGRGGVAGGGLESARRACASGRRSERTLRNSEERLKLALWGSGDELWDMDLITREMRRENSPARTGRERRYLHDGLGGAARHRASRGFSRCSISPSPTCWPGAWRSST